MGRDTMQFQVGDTVRVRVTPEVDEPLWDEEGVVLDVDPDNRLVVELGGGGESLLTPEQVDLVATREESDPSTLLGL